MDSSACFGTTLTESSSPNRSTPGSTKPSAVSVSSASTTGDSASPCRRVAPSAHPGSPRPPRFGLGVSWSVVVNCHRCIPCPPTSGRRWAAHHAGELGGGPLQFRENQPLLEAGARDVCADRGSKINLDSAHYPLSDGYSRSVASLTVPTLADAVEQWLTVKRAGRGLSPHTVRAYRADVATFAAHPSRGVPHRSRGRHPSRPFRAEPGGSDRSVVGDPGGWRRGQDPGPAARHPHGAVRLPDPATPAREGPVDRRRHRPAQGRETPAPLCGQARRVRAGHCGGGHPRPRGAGSLGRAGPGVSGIVGRHGRPRRRSVCAHRGRPCLGW